jgi:hypothetical protein
MALVLASDVATLVQRRLTQKENTLVDALVVNAQTDLRAWLRREVEDGAVHADELVQVDRRQCGRFIVRPRYAPIATVEDLKIDGTLIDPSAYVVRPNWIEMVGLLTIPSWSLINPILAVTVSYTTGMIDGSLDAFRGAVLSRVMREFRDGQSQQQRLERGEAGASAIAVEGYSVQYENDAIVPGTGYTEAELYRVQRFKRRTIR